MALHCGSGGVQFVWWPHLVEFSLDANLHGVPVLVVALHIGRTSAAGIVFDIFFVY